MIFDHIAIPVSEPVASRRFYEDVLGLSLAGAMAGDDWGGRGWLLMFFALDQGGVVALSCFRGAGPSPDVGLPSDARHVALGVEDVAVWRERFDRQGVAYREENHGAQTSLFVQDPDGAEWEITRPPGIALQDLGGVAQAERTIASWLLSASPGVEAAGGTSGKHESSLEGVAILIRYRSGVQIEATFQTSNRMTWKALTGPAAGRVGTETVSATEVRGGLWTVSWVEASSVTVGLTLDFQARAAWCYVTFEPGTGAPRQGRADQGSFDIVG